MLEVWLSEGFGETKVVLEKRRLARNALMDKEREEVSRDSQCGRAAAFSWLGMLLKRERERERESVNERCSC